MTAALCTPDVLFVAQQALSAGQSVADAARAAGVSRASLHRYVNMGRLEKRRPFKDAKPGTPVRIPKWVLPCERADYQDNAVLYGEHKAAEIGRAMAAARRQEA